MKTTIDNFIGVFDNALSHEVCDEIISVYEESQILNYAVTRQDVGFSHEEADNSIVFTDKEHMTNSIFFGQKLDHTYRILLTRRGNAIMSMLKNMVH